MARNSALHEEPRYARASIVSAPQEDSLLEWLKNTGRLVPRNAEELSYADEEEEELTEIMSTEETYDFDEEDEDALDLET